jgi:hypothetical protein
VKFAVWPLAPIWSLLNEAMVLADAGSSDSNGASAVTMKIGATTDKRRIQDRRPVPRAI